MYELVLAERLQGVASGTAGGETGRKGELEKRGVQAEGVWASKALSSSECVCLWDPGPRGLPRLHT